MSKTILFTALALFTGCTVSCPDGTEELGGACVPVNTPLGVDAALTDDAAYPADESVESDAAAMADSPSLSNETCDGRDEDQDGTIDESLTRACGSSTIGSCTMGTEHCENGAWVGCNAVLPQAAENCTTEGDENCNGQADEGCPCRDGQTQACGTDVGLCMPGTQTCRNQVWGSCTGGVLAATEVCNGMDEDCDGTSDNNVASVACGVETGECRAGMTRCSSGATTCEGAVGPAVEICNGLDDDCDGSTDEGVLQTFYQDSDADGHGNFAAPIQGCTPPAGYVTSGTDCNDSCRTCFPGNREVCDGLDNNCEAGIDDGLTFTNYYRDQDGDGYGAASTVISRCSNPGTGYIANGTDCDDADARAFPGQPLYFTTARYGVGGFDFDCDGRQTQRNTNAGSAGCDCRVTGRECQPPPLNICVTYTAPTPAQYTWVGSAPACGQSGQLENCGEGGAFTACMANGSTANSTQSCR